MGAFQDRCLLKFRGENLDTGTVSLTFETSHVQNECEECIPVLGGGGTF